LQTLFTFAKQVTLMRRSTVLSLPFQLMLSGQTYQDRQAGKQTERQTLRLAG
jgi:hypothetical protein